jgi:plasmid stabilization system protein ParE
MKKCKTSSPPKQAPKPGHVLLEAADLNVPPPAIGSPAIKQRHELRASPGHVVLEAAYLNVSPPVVGATPESPKAPPSKAERKNKLARVYDLLVELDREGRLRDDMHPREIREIVVPAYRVWCRRDKDAEVDAEVSPRTIERAWQKRQSER